MTIIIASIIWLFEKVTGRNAVFLFTAIALCVHIRAATSYSEFYVQTTGSNLNAGDTTGNSAVNTYTSDLVSGWNSGTGVFTVSGGANPSSDGVVTNRFASVYVTSGATTNTFVGRITAVSATTITVDVTTAKSGTAPATDLLGGTTLKYGGAWAGPNGAGVSFPGGFITATLTNWAASTSNPLYPRVNILSGTSYTTTAALTFSTAGPIRWQGYTSTPGDGGRATIANSSAATSYVLFTVSAANNDFADLIFDGSVFTAGSSDLVSVTAAENMFNRCVFQKARKSGVSSSQVGLVFNQCEAWNCNTNNSAANGGFTLTGAGFLLDRCISHHNAGSNVPGFVLGTSGTAKNCVADSNGKEGFQVTSTINSSLINCVAYFNGGSGIDLTGASAAVFTIQNCLFIKNGGYGITSSGSTLRNGNIMNCAFAAATGTQTNVLGDINRNVIGAINETGTITLSVDVSGMVSPSTGNFNPIIGGGLWGTGTGLFTETMSSYTGTQSYPDVGAAQHITPTIGSVFGP